MTTSLKVKGAVLKKFYEDENVWPGKTYQDDVFITTEDGVELEDYIDISDDINLIVECGRIFREDDKDITGTDFIEVLSSWMQTHYPEIFSGAELDVIFRLVKFGPCASGDLPSKTGGASLIERGLATMVVGPGSSLLYAALPDLIPVFNKHFDPLTSKQ